MYGFGSPGGVIHYRTKQPTDDAMLTTEVGFRNSSVFFGRMDAGGPLDEDGRFRYRLNLAAENGTAYNKAGVNRYVGSLALDYEIAPNLRWYATLTFEDSNLKREPFQIYWEYDGAETPVPTYDYEKLSISNSFYKTNTLSMATGLEWEFAENWSVDFKYGYTRKNHRSNKMFINIYNEAGDYNGGVYNFPGRNTGNFTQAMVQGSFDTGLIRHEIVFGSSYQLERSTYGEFYWGNDFDGNVYKFQDFTVTREINFDLTGTTRKTTQTAAFMSDTLHFGEKWQAVIGARYTRQKLSGNDYQTSAVTPTFGLIYKPVQELSIYGSYVESMEGGTRVNETYANVGDILDATISKQYEIGVKYQADRMSVTAAGFRVARANRIDSLTDGLRYLTQDGLTVYKGLELIGNYQLNDDFSFGMGLVYLDPEISNVSLENVGILGNIPAEAAKWQLVGNVEYNIPWVSGLSIHGNVRYFGKAPTTNNNILFIKGRTLTNVGFSYETEIGGHPVGLTANVNNLFNVKYWGLSNFGEAVNGAVSVKVHW